ncbi:MAG: DegT/DnrJ/EryC1/StrS family aminotransferase [Fibrobacteres bacterium]|nr:DegT/DnrJ/EryC1/StrS family aminotransferase [Fibrobacterota bacterium]
MTTDIPFVDLEPQYRDAGADIEEAALRVLRSRRYVLGPEVAAFETEFAAAIGTRFCVGTDSGTSALRLALQASGVGPGDEVITTPATFIATVEAIRQTGAKAILADIDPLTWNLDPARLEAVIGPRSRAILPVHLHGRAADLCAFGELCLHHGLTLIEDAAQAHLAHHGGRKCGAMGIAGCFSFYPGKNLGAAGEGGAVVTSDPEIARRVAMLRDFGSEKKYEHVLHGGTNARLESIQAAILRAKLPYLESWTQDRERIAKRYMEGLAGLPLTLPADVGANNRHVWHVFAVRHPRRDWLREQLAERGIETGTHYPKPVHLQPACEHLGYREGDFPHAEAFCRETLSLPLWTGMPDSVQDRVIETLSDLLAP